MIFACNQDSRSWYAAWDFYPDSARHNLKRQAAQASVGTSLKR